MARTLPIAAALMLLLPAPLAAQESCATCLGQDASAHDERPLVIEITSGITFSRLALTGDGKAQADIDAQTGEKHTDGSVMDLGGNAVQGRARITGMPNRAVRISFPGSVTMTSATGGTAELADFSTDLPAWPVLDSSGVLEFSFGGSLKLNGVVGGTLRGRIPITVDYN